MQKNPLVSIIVPNYNHAKYLRKRLDSIFNQTFKDFEVILLDDKSIDNSIEVLDSYTDFRISHRIYNEENSGSPFKQWKKGLELAKGDLIWIAESDDWADEKFLELMVPIFKQNKDISIGYCNMYYVDENGDMFPETFEEYTSYAHPKYWKDNHCSDGGDYVKKYMINKCIIANASAVVFRKELGLKYIDKILDYKQAGDWLFWNTILSEPNYKVYYRASDKLNYFRHSLQSTRNYPTLEKKQNGLLERINVIYQTIRIHNLEQNVLIVKKREMLDWWSKDHSILEIMKKTFVKILTTEMYSDTSAVSLYIHYFKYRIKNIPFIKSIIYQSYVK